MTTAQFLTKEQKELNAPQKEKQIQGIASTHNYYVSGGGGSSVSSKSGGGSISTNLGSGGEGSSTCVVSDDKSRQEIKGTKMVEVIDTKDISSVLDVV